MAQGGQDTLVGHLGHGWMSVDGASNIFEQCSHFESKGPFTNQLTDVSSNALDTKDSMIVFSSADSNESSRLLSLLSEGSSVCTERELSNDDRMASGFSLFW